MGPGMVDAVGAVLIKVRGFRAVENGRRKRERERERERAHRKLGLRSHDKFVPRHVRLHPWVEGDDTLIKISAARQHVTGS